MAAFAWLGDRCNRPKSEIVPEENAQTYHAAEIAPTGFAAANNCADSQCVHFRRILKLNFDIFLDQPRISGPRP